MRSASICFSWYSPTFRIRRTSASSSTRFCRSFADLHVLRVGLIGYGAIGRQVADGIVTGVAGEAELCAVLVRHRPSQRVAAPILTDLREFLVCAPQVVLEAASPDAVV